MLAQVGGDQNILAAISSGLDLHGLAAVKVFELNCEPNEVKDKYPDLRNQIKEIQWDQHGNRPRFRYTSRQQSGRWVLPCFLPFLPLFPSVELSPSKNGLAQDRLLPRFLRFFPTLTTRSRDNGPLDLRC